MAEGAGFEPATPFGEHAFQACALNHSAIPPWKGGTCNPTRGEPQELPGRQRGPGERRIRSDVPSRATLRAADRRLSPAVPDKVPVFGRRAVERAAQAP